MLKLIIVTLLSALLIAIGSRGSDPSLTRSPCPRALKINTNYQWRNSLHFICLQVKANQMPQLDVVEYASQKLVVSVPISEMNINQMASFVDDDGTLRVLVAVPDKINGTSMYSFDSQGHYVNERFTANTQFVGTMSVWRLELNWEWHLATANHPYIESLLTDSARASRKPIPDAGPIISIHSWRSSYFDRYQLINLPPDARINKLEPMHIYDQEFLIVALESSRNPAQRIGYSPTSSSPLRTDSMIFRLDFSDGSLNWVHYQYLGTSHANDASSFVITHKSSLKQDYYIALIGQGEPEPTGLSGIGGRASGRQHGLLIYKYLGDRFMETHFKPVEGASRLDTISYGSGDSYVVIAVLSDWSKQINIFLFDGLNLNEQVVPTAQGQYPGRPTPQTFRRPINSDSLRLFRAPINSVPPPDQMGGTYEKRTLSDNDILGLAFSTSLDTYVSDANETSSSEAPASSSDITSEGLYKIPINELITNDERAYAKRDFVGQDLLGWCKSQIGTILNDKFENSAQVLSQLPRVDQPRPIQLNGDVIIEGDLHISNLLYVNKIEDNSNQGPNRVLNSQMPINSAKTFEDIELAHRSIDSMKRRVDELLVEDGTLQEIYAPLRFDRVVIECVGPQVGPVSPIRPFPFANVPPSCLQVGSIWTQWLNDFNVHDIRDQALLTGRSMRVKNDIRFEHLVLRGKTQILDTLNGIRVEDIVFRRGPSTGPVLGHKNLLSGLFSSTNLIVENWLGFRVDRQNYLTASGDQRIEADLRFSHVVVGGNGAVYNASSRIEILNGLHLDTHLSRIAQADGNNHFDVPLSFDELIIRGPAHLPIGSRLSSVDLEELWMRTMFKHSNQNVTAPMEFLGDVHVSYGGDIAVDGPINGVFLHPDNVMMRNRNYDIGNPIIFDGHLTVDRLEARRDINGVQVVNNYETGRAELGLLLDGGTQYISGDKIFNEIRLGGNSRISGLVNGQLNITQLDSMVRNDGRPYRFGKVTLSGNNVQLADNVNMHINSLINGVPANDICGLANKLNRPMSSQYNRLRFEQPVSFSSIKCASVNGFNDLASSFLTRYGNQRVAGALKLLNGVVFNSSLEILSVYNNLNVSSMSTAINQVISETISGHKDFYGDLYIDELNANVINDLPLSRVFIARSDHPQYISAPLTFDHLDIENILVIGQDFMMHSFNGLNVSDIITNTLQYDTPQVIYNHVELDHLHITPGANLITKSLNGRDLRQVFSDAVLVDVPQQIIAPKSFNAPVVFADRVGLRYGIDGLSEEQIKFNVLLQSDELIENDLEFDNDVFVMKSLEIQTGLINDIDVNMFVQSMLHEQQSTGLRLVDNSSLRFHDVRLNNLVVTGTIQGLDFSRDALTRNDNLNGSYDANIRAQQVLINNQRLFDHLYQTKPTFRVQTSYRNESLTGQCQIHSCPQTTPMISSPTGSYLPLRLPNPMSSVRQPAGMAPGLPQYAPVWRPKTIPLRPVLHNNTQHAPHAIQPFSTHGIRPAAHAEPLSFGLADPKMLEYQARLKAQAIRDLSSRVNKYLSFSFYYEIAQKHPLLGPVLHAASNPNEPGNANLLLKAASKKGEPCLHRGQKIDVMSQQRQKGLDLSFTISSRIQETSSPSITESVVVGNDHYLFVADVLPEGSVASETSSQILVYLWNYKTGMYDLRQRLHIDGFPTALRAFVVNQFACIALANPGVVQSNHTGAPLLYCQQSTQSEFNQRIVLPLHNIFDLDIYTIPQSSQILIAALAQQHTEQVGDLVVSKFDVLTRSLVNMAMRRTARPLKLHFIRQLSKRIQLVVSEGITSNDAALATTRIFTLQLDGHLSESQIIKDNQFADIQSVFLDADHSMLFMKSTHSISIYAPLGDGSCELSLVQRLPMKGANKFLVFNNNLATKSRHTNSVQPYGHILVLSKEDCEHQQYSTVILKPKFG